MDDPRAKQALYMAKSKSRSSFGPFSGPAVVWLVLTAAAIAGAVWVFLSLL